MPARRSRTTEWRRCLREILDRKGAIEIAVMRRYEEDEPGSHLIWRVHLLDIKPKEIVVEQPMALGRTIEIQPGVELVAIISIGQNRWMFTTRHLGLVEQPGERGSTIQALRLSLPDRVQRCQRRSYYRVNTAALNLPKVEMWPLLDPKTVLVAERANELQFQRDLAGASKPPAPGMKLDSDEIMPDVGPRFSGALVNVGGGGVGIVVPGGEGQALQRHKVFWLRFQLPPELSTPICATGKLVHTHIQSNMATYAGLSFDFTFNPGHQRFVVDQISRYISVQQRMQMEQPSSRRSA